MRLHEIRYGVATKADGTYRAALLIDGEYLEHDEVCATHEEARAVGRLLRDVIEADLATKGVELVWSSERHGPIES